jgi:hypothetical protein
MHEIILVEIFGEDHLRDIGGRKQEDVKEIGVGGVEFNLYES